MRLSSSTDAIAQCILNFFPDFSTEATIPIEAMHYSILCSNCKKITQDLRTDSMGRVGKTFPTLQVALN
ncbi:MAG: hypothetical protein F6K44_08450 [Moorea sp. SIO3E2]|nr:hypothetical protein [Moorena sp. SIO3E2]